MHSLNQPLRCFRFVRVLHTGCLARGILRNWIVREQNSSEFAREHLSHAFLLGNFKQEWHRFCHLKIQIAASYFTT